MYTVQQQQPYIPYRIVFKANEYNTGVHIITKQTKTVNVLVIVVCVSEQQAMAGTAAAHGCGRTIDNDSKYTHTHTRKHTTTNRIKTWCVNKSLD